MAIFDPSKTAKACPALGDLTTMHAKGACESACVARRVLGELKGFAGAVVKTLDLGPDLFKMIPDTRCTKADHA